LRISGTFHITKNLFVFYGLDDPYPDLPPQGKEQNPQLKEIIKGAPMLIKKRKYSRRVTSNISIFVINKGFKGIIFAHKLLV
jgi:hypothetical protein